MDSAATMDFVTLIAHHPTGQVLCVMMALRRLQLEVAHALDMAVSIVGTATATNALFRRLRVAQIERLHHIDGTIK